MLRKWELELIDGPMRSVVTLLYRGPNGQAIIWDTVDGPSLPEAPSSMRVMDELYGALLEMIQNAGSQG